MESDIHCDQARLYLIEPLRRHFEETGFVAWVSGNSFVYYSGGSAVGPDMYVVNGGIPRGQEKWVVWEEGGLMPTLIVELVSPSTEHVDRGRKYRLYQDVFHCPDYFLFNTTTQRLEAFRLEEGSYLRVLPDADGSFACSSLPGLRVGSRDGWLRFIRSDGSLLPTGAELARQAAEQAEAERLRATAAEAEVRAMRARMLEMEEEMRRLRASKPPDR